jgi:hypothetical protein
MLDANELANAIIGNMKEADNPTDAHANFGATLEKYLNNNLRIIGIYNGVLPDGNADPLSGEYKWKITTFPYSASEVQQTATNGFISWVAGLISQFNKMQFIGNDEANTITTITPASFLSSPLNIDFSDKPIRMQDAMQRVAEGIFNCLRSSSVFPISASAKSSANGIGAVTWARIE